MEPTIPYLVAAGVAFLVALAELFRSFGSSFFLALRSPWAWLLLAVNTAFALVTYSLAALTLNIEPGPVSAAVCGVVFPSILRSRFTFFRAVGDKDDPNVPSISVPLDRMYTEIQKRCYREVDSRQAAHRAVKAQALASRTTEGKLVAALKKIIAARKVAEEREADEEYLEQLVAVQDKEMRRYRLAMFFLDIAGGREDEFLTP